MQFYWWQIPSASVQIDDSPDSHMVAYFAGLSAMSLERITLRFSVTWWLSLKYYNKKKTSWNNLSRRDCYLRDHSISCSYWNVCFFYSVRWKGSIMSWLYHCFSLQRLHSYIMFSWICQIIVDIAPISCPILFTSNVAKYAANFRYSLDMTNLCSFEIELNLTLWPIQI